jgi:hypothetical protein
MAFLSRLCKSRPVPVGAGPEWFPRPSTRTGTGMGVGRKRTAWNLLGLGFVLDRRDGHLVGYRIVVRAQGSLSLPWAHGEPPPARGVSETLQALCLY